jgi:RNA polymerase sigma factor (sigma-70 family)
MPVIISDRKSRGYFFFDRSARLPYPLMPTHGGNYMTEAVLWKQWQDSPTTDNRNALTLLFDPFVMHIARRVHARVPESVHWDDIVSEGRLAVMECIGRYQPEAEVRFSDFAGRRIEGAMLDFLRSEDIIPDARRRRMNETIASLDNAQNDGPITIQEAADLTDRTVSQLDEAIGGTLGCLHDIARCRTPSRDDLEHLITLDHAGLWIVPSPGFSISIQLSDVVSFGDRVSYERCEPALSEPSRYYGELNLDTALCYEWQFATVSTDFDPRPHYRELRMSDVLDRIELKITRKKAELLALEKLHQQLTDPFIATEMAEMLGATPPPKPAPGVKRKLPTPVTTLIVEHFQKTDNLSAAVQEVAQATGLKTVQVRAAVAGPRQTRFSVDKSSSNGVLRYRLSTT